MLKLPSVTVSKVTTLADKSIRITLDVPELPPKQMADIFIAYMKGEQGVEIADIKVEGKSPSKELRDKMFVYYTETKGIKEGFDGWYKEQLKIIGEKYLNKIL